MKGNSSLKPFFLKLALLGCDKLFGINLVTPFENTFSLFPESFLIDSTLMRRIVLNCYFPLDSKTDAIFKREVKDL